MNTTTVEQVASLLDGELIMGLRGTIKRSFGRKTGTNSKGEWSVENCIFSDDTGEIKAAFWNHDDLKELVGQEVLIVSTKSDRGFNGITAKDNEYQGKTTRELNISGAADTQEASPDSAISPPARPSAPAVSTPPPTKQNAATGLQAFREALMRNANAFHLIKKAVAIEMEQTGISNIAPTPEMFQSEVMSNFISLERAGLVSKLPITPIWSATTKESAEEPW